MIFKFAGLLDCSVHLEHQINSFCTVMVAWFEQNLHKVICLEYAPSPKPGSLSMNPCVPVFNSSSSSTVYVSRKACFFARVASQLLKQERKIREIHSGSVLPPKDGQNLRQSGEPPKKTEVDSVDSVDSDYWTSKQPQPSPAKQPLGFEALGGAFQFLANSSMASAAVFAPSWYSGTWTL